MIRKATTSDLTVLKAIWKEIFDDTTEYISLFFDKALEPLNCFVDEINGAISGMIFYNDYDLRVNNITCKASYICGIAVLPFYRGKGIMKALLNHTNSYLKTNKFDFAVLIPATCELYDTYKKFGFSKNFSTYTLKTNFKCIKKAPKAFFKTDTLPFSIYKKVTENIDNILLQSKNNIAVNNEYIKLMAGNSLYFDDGFCYYYIENTTLIIKECFIKKELLPSLLWYFKNNFTFNEVEIYSFYNIGPEVYKGMVLTLGDVALPKNSYMNMMLD